MTTFEEKYRRKSLLPEVAPVPPELPLSSGIEALRAAAEHEYKAFNFGAHAELELWIRPNAANAWTDVYLPYSYRNHMISDGSGFVVSMHYGTPIIAVTLHGRNLQGLVHLLSKRQVEWVMEYDARKWGELAADAPCITGIEIRHASRPARKDDDVLPAERKQPEPAATH